MQLKNFDIIYCFHIIRSGKLNLSQIKIIDKNLLFLKRKEKKKKTNF